MKAGWINFTLKEHRDERKVILLIDIQVSTPEHKHEELGIRLNIKKNRMFILVIPLPETYCELRITKNN